MSATANAFVQNLDRREFGPEIITLEFLAWKATEEGKLYEEGRWCNTPEKIAKEISISRKKTSATTIRRHIRKLMQLGLVKVDKPRRNGSSEANLLSIIFCPLEREIAKRKEATRLIQQATKNRLKAKQKDLFDSVANIADEAISKTVEAAVEVKEVISEKKSEISAAWAEWCQDPQSFISKKATPKVSQEQLAKLDTSPNAIATPASLAAIYEQEFAAWIEKGTAAPAEYTGDSKAWAFELFDHHHDESDSKPFRTNAGCRKFIRACREYSFRNSGQKSLWFFLQPGTDGVRNMVIDQKLLPKAQKSSQQPQQVQPQAAQKQESTKASDVSVSTTPAFQKYAVSAQPQKPKKGMSPLSGFLTGLKGGE